MKVEIIYPLPDSKQVVINPMIQWGLPTVQGTRITTRTLYNLYLGGESVDFIAALYNISTVQVLNAIKYEKLPIGRRHKYEKHGRDQALKLWE